MLIRLSIIVLCLLIGTPYGVASERAIRDIRVIHNDRNILVSAKYEGDLLPQIKKEIMQGIPREFFYYIVLYRDIPNWLDEEKTATTIKYTIKYNTLKGQFIITKEVNRKGENIIYDSYKEMMDSISRIDKVKVAPLNMLSSNHKYYIGIKAEIKAGKLPFLLKYFMFFIPYSEFSTPWYYSSKFTLRDFQ